MKKFILNISYSLLAVIIALLVLLLGYLIYDPFKVVKIYSNYSNLSVIPNRDYISTEMFIKNQPEQNYNSFIFGSSRTLAFKPATWKKYLPADARVFMFDASQESVYGLYTKLKYLDSLRTPIDNALIVICRDVTFSTTENYKGHLMIKHTATSKESKIVFHYNFLKAYLSPRFLFSFYVYTFSKKFRPFMTGYVVNKKIPVDSVNNGIRLVDLENEITGNPDQYYQQRKNIFYDRLQETTDSVSGIAPVQKYMLEEINKILIKNNTDFKIVISPLYDQVKINSNDLKILHDIFGNQVYDFSGKNRFTDSMYNYYERSHYRPVVGDSILSIVYK